MASKFPFCFPQTHLQDFSPLYPFLPPSPFHGSGTLEISSRAPTGPPWPSSQVFSALPRFHSSSLISKCPRPDLSPQCSQSSLSLGPPRPPPSTGVIEETETVTLSGAAYLSCPPPRHQLRPQGPGPGPELPAGAGTVGPCSGWWGYWRRKCRVRLQDGLSLAPDHIRVDSHISWPKAHCPHLTVNSLVSDPVSPPGDSSQEPRPGL